MGHDTFDVLFLIARPGAGKSEIIDYLKRTPEAERRERYHIGSFVELDDFPMLWTWFEEDRILEAMGKPRLHTDAGEYFRYPYLWHVLIRRLGLEYEKLLRDRPGYHREGRTVIVEFSRGAEHGGFKAAFEHFPEHMLRHGAILYIEVSWAESLRKNRTRFNPSRPDSILEHGLSDEKLARLYEYSDWASLSTGDPDHLFIRDQRVPYAVFANEDDVTTPRGEALGQRLAESLGRLWHNYRQQA